MRALLLLSYFPLWCRLVKVHWLEIPFANSTTTVGPTLFVLPSACPKSPLESLLTPLQCSFENVRSVCSHDTIRQQSLNLCDSGIVKNASVAPMLHRSHTHDNSDMVLGMLITKSHPPPVARLMSSLASLMHQRSHFLRRLASFVTMTRNALHSLGTTVCIVLLFTVVWIAVWFTVATRPYCQTDRTSAKIVGSIKMVSTEHIECRCGCDGERESPSSDGERTSRKNAANDFSVTNPVPLRNGQSTKFRLQVQTPLTKVVPPFHVDEGPTLMDNREGTKSANFPAESPPVSAMDTVEAQGVVTNVTHCVTNDNDERPDHDWLAEGSACIALPSAVDADAHEVVRSAVATRKGDDVVEVPTTETHERATTVTPTWLQLSVDDDEPEIKKLRSEHDKHGVVALTRTEFSQQEEKCSVILTDSIHGNEFEFPCFIESACGSLHESEVVTTGCDHEDHGFVSLISSTAPPKSSVIVHSHQEGATVIENPCLCQSNPLGNELLTCTTFIASVPIEGEPKDTRSNGEAGCLKNHSEQVVDEVTLLPGELLSGLSRNWGQLETRSSHGVVGNETPWGQLQQPSLLTTDLSASTRESGDDCKTEDEASSASSPIRKHATVSTVTVVSAFEEGMGQDNLIDDTGVSTFEAERGNQDNDDGAAAISSYFHAGIVHNATDHGLLAPRSTEIEPAQRSNNDTSVLVSPLEVETDDKETDDLAHEGETEQNDNDETQCIISYDASLVDSYVEAELGQNGPASSIDGKSIDVSYCKVERGQKPNTDAFAVAVVESKAEQPTNERLVGSPFETEPGQKPNDDTATVVSVSVGAEPREEANDSTILVLSSFVDEAEQATNEFTSTVLTSVEAETKHKLVDNLYPEAETGLDEKSERTVSVNDRSNISRPAEAEPGPKPNAETTATTRNERSVIESTLEQEHGRKSEDDTSFDLSSVEREPGENPEDNSVLFVPSVEGDKELQHPLALVETKPTQNTNDDTSIDLSFVKKKPGAQATNDKSTVSSHVELETAQTENDDREAVVIPSAVAESGQRANNDTFIISSTVQSEEQTETSDISIASSPVPVGTKQTSTDEIALEPELGRRENDDTNDIILSSGEAEAEQNDDSLVSLSSSEAEQRLKLDEDLSIAPPSVKEETEQNTFKDKSIVAASVDSDTGQTGNDDAFETESGQNVHDDTSVGLLSAKAETGQMVIGDKTAAVSSHVEAEGEQKPAVNESFTLFSVEAKPDRKENEDTPATMLSSVEAKTRCTKNIDTAALIIPLEAEPGQQVIDDVSVEATKGKKENDDTSEVVVRSVEQGARQDNDDTSGFDADKKYNLANDTAASLSPVETTTEQETDDGSTLLLPIESSRDATNFTEEESPTDIPPHTSSLSLPETPIVLIASIDGDTAAKNRNTNEDGDVIVAGGFSAAPSRSASSSAEPVLLNNNVAVEAALLDGSAELPILAGCPRIVSPTDEMEPELINGARSIEQDDDVRSPSVYELEPKRLIILVSNGVPDRVQAKNQWRALNLLAAKGTPYTLVDAMDSNQRARRNELFEISQIRSSYPQVFIEFSDGTTAFVGDWDFLEELNDASSLPEEVLDANPQILTWKRMFCNVVESFEK